MTGAIVLTLTLFTATQSASTLAAVTMFTTNVDRTWPADDREPFVTVEALRLMETAAAAIADEGKVNTGKVKDAIADLTKARESLEAHASDDEHSRLTREALLTGHEMVEALVESQRAARDTRQKLSELKRAAESLDRKKPAREQGEVLQRYFRHAAELLRAMIASQT